MNLQTLIHRITLVVLFSTLWLTPPMAGAAQPSDGRTWPHLVEAGLKPVVPLNLDGSSEGRRQSAQAASYPLHAGFPIDVQGQILTSPAVADLNNDGKNEIVVATHAGEIYAWNANGSIRAGYPLGTGGLIISHIALGDLNGNGNLEIVVGAGSVEAGVQGKVFAWRPNGALLSGWPQNVARYGNAKPSRISTVVLADVDGNGDLEVVAGTNNNTVDIPNADDIKVPDLYVWHHNGNLLNGNWPAKDNPAILGGVAVGDLNSDNQMEIVTGRDYHALFAYDRLGVDLPGWPVTTLLSKNGGNINSEPRIIYKTSAVSLADLEGDGTVEYIVAGFRKQPNKVTEVNTDLLVLQADGTRRPGWETPASGAGMLANDYDMDLAPSVADLNKDGKLEIIMPTQDGWIRAYEADKTLLWQFDFAKGKDILSSEAVVGDVDNDGHNEVLFGTYDPDDGTTGPVGLWILEHDGSVKAGSPLAVAGPGIYAAPALADLNGDGNLDIIAASKKGTVYAWDTGSLLRPGLLPWPVARQNVQRTAYVDPDKLAPHLNASVKMANPISAQQGERIGYTTRLLRSGLPLTHTVRLTDVIPPGLTYIPGSLTATHGVPDDSQAPLLRWTGFLSETDLVDISYEVGVTESATLLIPNPSIIDMASTGPITRSVTVLVNGEEMYLPLFFK